MYTYSARTWRNLRQEAPGLPVRRVVMHRGTHLEYEDVQVWVCHRKTTCDDATGSATYGTYPVKEKGRVLGRGEEDGALPAMMISYSSLIWVGVDIISWRPDGMGKRPLG